jgi:DNA polymerase III epsilon subunit family exonuclease
MFDLTTARFAFLDIETTGLSPWFGDRICQIGIVLTEGKRIKKTFESLVNPERDLSPAAEYVNGLNAEELSQALRFEELIGRVESLLKDTIVVCHNAKFDIQFIDSEYRRLGGQAQYPNLIDTLLIARQFFTLPSYSLHALAETFQVPVIEEGPRAVADAMTTKNVFFGMMEALKEFNRPLDDFIGIYNSPAWPDEGVMLPTELSEAIESGKPLFIKYVNKDGEISERWVTPVQVMGLADYIYLQAYCHSREAERTFRLDRILNVSVQVDRE